MTMSMITLVRIDFVNKIVTNTEFSLFDVRENFKFAILIKISIDSTAVVSC